MSKLFIEDTTLTAIGNAIRNKEGSEGLIPTTEMAERISNLPSGSESPFGKIIAFNYDVPRNWTATVEEAEI